VGALALGGLDDARAVLVRPLVGESRLAGMTTTQLGHERVFAAITAG
jgi:hypothetical protein